MSRYISFQDELEDMIFIQYEEMLQTLLPRIQHLSMSNPGFWCMQDIYEVWPFAMGY